MAKYHVAPPELIEDTAWLDCKKEIQIWQGLTTYLLLNMIQDAAWLDYKKEIQIWQGVTDLPATKQDPTICMSLTEKAREAALELGIEKKSMHADRV